MTSFNTNNVMLEYPFYFLSQNSDITIHLKLNSTFSQANRFEIQVKLFLNEEKQLQKGIWMQF